MSESPVAVVGAGIGGLSAALTLAAQGIAVEVFERASRPGGKMRTLEVDGAPIDSGPTVFTMRPVFEELFDDAGASFADEVSARPMEVLARHAWNDEERLDLFADRERSAAAISEFSSPAEGRRYLDFCAAAGRTFATLDSPFIRAQRPNPVTLVQRTAAAGLNGLTAIRPFTRMWSALQSHFSDPRLQQLFGRYATYCGSSPFLAPATLTLVAHVEQEGVWTLDGGMHRLAEAMTRVAERRGVRFRFDTPVAELHLSDGRIAALSDRAGNRYDVGAVVCNADPAALSASLFGDQVRRAVRPLPRGERSLSALTWSLKARTEGFPLLHHNVFFSSDYRREFDDIFRGGRLPHEPTVYLCAQDRRGGETVTAETPERLFCLVNAPAVGDTYEFTTSEIEACATRTFEMLRRCGLQLEHNPQQQRVTTPNEFERLFPATGGALYGPASHGWRASFRRPGARTPIRGLYLAGGSTHPGPGIPMAAVSGRLAAQRLLADRISRGRSSRVAMPGGISTP